MLTDNDKTKKSETIISICNLVLVIIAVAISYIAFSHDKRNSPLIISYEHNELGKYSSYESNAEYSSYESNSDNKTDNINGSQTPSIRNITGDVSNEFPVYIDKDYLLKLSFKKTQGDISRIYTVNFSNNKLIYEQPNLEKTTNCN